MRRHRTPEQKKLIKLFFRLLFVFLVGALIFFMCEMTLESSRSSDRIYVYIFGCLLLLYVVYKADVVQILCDREWSGDIVSIRLRNGWYCPALLPTGTKMKPTVYIDLTVRRADGKVKKISYNTVHIPASYYFEGMKVRHIPGANYLIYLAPPKEKIICPMCAETLDAPDCSKCKISF